MISCHSRSVFEHLCQAVCQALRMHGEPSQSSRSSGKKRQVNRWFRLYEKCCDCSSTRYHKEEHAREEPLIFSWGWYIVGEDCLEKMTKRHPNRLARSKSDSLAIHSIQNTGLEVKKIPCELEERLNESWVGAWWDWRKRQRPDMARLWKLCQVLEGPSAGSASNQSCCQSVILGLMIGWRQD